MEPGTLIKERYRVVRDIGQGCFGHVYLAEDIHTDELRAVKVLLPWAKQDEKLQRRLLREAKLARELQSDHVVRIDDYGTDADGRVFIAMEYLQGPALNEVREAADDLPVARVAAIAKQILAALQSAHALGVIHRDLKPENVFLIERDGQRDFVKVFDFGIAKVMRDADLRASVDLTEKGTILGTPAYMSPEQCAGDELTPASDLYSLAVMLYELLTGSLPFAHDNPIQILMMHATQPPPPLPLEIARTHLGAAVMRALEKDPAARFSTAAEFAGAIDGNSPPAAEVPQVAAELPAQAAAEKAPEKSVLTSLIGIFKRK